MRKRNIYRNSISRITRSVVVLAAALPALLLPSGCERENLLKELAGEEAVMRFSVSESVPELLTKSQAADRKETTEENVIVLTSADGRTLRLIAEEEPLSVRTSPAAVPETKAVKIYKKPASSSEVALGGDPIAVWAYNIAATALEFKNWRLDGGLPKSGSNAIPVQVEKDGTYWKPTPDIQFNTEKLNAYRTRWFALAPWDAYNSTDITLNYIPSSTQTTLTMDYTVPSAINAQWDLLASTSESREIADTDPVDLTFLHVLTGVRFKRDKDLNISNITVSGVYNSATLDLLKLPQTPQPLSSGSAPSLSEYTNVDETSTSDATKDLWSNRTKSVTAPATEPSWTMDMSASGTWTNGNPKDNTKEKQYDYAKEDANILMMIPQLTPQGAKITVTVNDPIAGPTPFTGDISGHRWLPGRMVTYRIDEEGVQMVTDYMELVVVPSDANGTEYTLPFTGTFPAYTMVYWDYSPSSTTPDVTFEKGASAENITHTYPADGQEHTIRIEVRAEPGAPQIPQVYGGFTPNYTTLPASGPRSAYTKKMLKRIPTPLLKTSSATMNNALAGQVNLETVCEDLFINNPQVTSFENTFAACTSLVLAPLDKCSLFSQNSVATNFKGVFWWCTSIERIPDHLFDGATVAEYFSLAFAYCSKLYHIPDELFYKNKVAKSFSQIFGDCTKLEVVPDKLFYENKRAEIFSWAFQDSGLKKIPDNFFDENKDAKNFYATFQRTKITSIPDNLFDNNTQAEDFGHTFSETRITEVPDRLFYYNDRVTSFIACFQSCSTLTTIYQYLFGEAGVREKTAVKTDCGLLFNTCPKLEEIPTGLFDCIPNASSFWSVFSNCSTISSIPPGLFDKNTKATDFSGVFSGSSIETVPVDLFKHNTKATNFKSAFYGCSSLESVPTGLFAHNRLVTNFIETFACCIKLVPHANIFIDPAADIPITKENRFTDVTSIDFSRCFANHWETRPSGWSSITLLSGSVAPDLWNYTLPSSTTKTECFADRPGLAGPGGEAIPTAWIQK